MSYLNKPSQKHWTQTDVWAWLCSFFFFFLNTLKVHWQMITSVLGGCKWWQENCKQPPQPPPSTPPKKKGGGGEKGKEKAAEKEKKNCFRCRGVKGGGLVMKMSRVGAWTISQGKLFQSLTVLGKKLVLDCTKPLQFLGRNWFSVLFCRSTAHNTGHCHA